MQYHLAMNIQAYGYLELIPKKGRQKDNFVAFVHEGCRKQNGYVFIQWNLSFLTIKFSLGYFELVKYYNLRSL